MLIWAGADGDGLFSSSLFAFVFETRDWSAVAFSSTSFSPGPRHFHSSVLYRDKLYIFGGKSNGYLSDLWSFDFATKSWQELDGHHSKTANKPIARFGHTAVCYEDQMIVFGGYDQHGFCCEDVPLWDFNAASPDLAWKRIQTDNQSSLKLERYHHSAVQEGHSMYIFGGKNAATSSSSLCEPHLLELHIPTRQWSLVHTVGTPPSARFGHSATVVNGRMFIFGGCDGNSSYSDLYSYCFVARTWEFVQVSTCPAPRYFATMSPLGDDLGSICLMGGRDLSNFCMSDVHVFRPSAPIVVSDSPSPRHPSYSFSYSSSSNLPQSPTSSSLVPSPPSSSNSAPPSPASASSSPAAPFGPTQPSSTSSTSTTTSSSSSAGPNLSTSPPPQSSSFSKRRKDESRSSRKPRKKGQSSRQQLVVTLKCEYEGEIRVLPIQPDAITFAELLGLLSREYAQPILKVQYRDQDGDFITVRSQSDWEMLKQFLPSLVSKAANNTLKLYLSSSSAPPPSPLLTLRSPTQTQHSSPMPRLTTTTTSAPVVEDVVVQWKKGPLLGRGAFGEVYLALANTGEFLAVKQVRLPDNEDSGSDSSTQSRAVRSLRQEIQLMKDLDHPNIVRYLGTQHVDNTLNIFLEFVPGGSIATLLVKFQRFPEDVIRSFTKQILAGLTYLHEHHIIHRDIKGANLLVGVNGVIKVADFGASKKLVNLTGSFTASHAGDGVGFKQHTVAGSPYWMAPEVIQSVPYDQRADTWSLGAAVIEMFTGAPPFSEFEPVPAMFHIASGATPKVPPASSPVAQDFLAACFTRDPSTRPSASQLLATHPFVAETEIPRRIAASTAMAAASLAPSAPLIFQKDPATQPQAQPASPSEPIMFLSSQSFHSELLSYLQQHSSTSQSFL